MKELSAKEMLDNLNVLRISAKMKPRKSWKESKEKLKMAIAKLMIDVRPPGAIMLSAYDWGLKYESCALEARKQFDIDYPGLGQPGWYEYCDIGDWLVCQLGKLPDNKLKEIIPALLRAVNKIVDRAVKNYTLNCGVIAVEQWARHWLDGTDRSRSSAKAAMAAAIGIKAGLAVKAAIEAIEAEEIAAARGMAYWAVASALRVSAAAAEISADYLKELKLQAQDIRSEIPNWPS